MDENSIFGTSPGRCWECGSPSMRAVSDGYDTNFFCPSCLACWRIVLGHVYRVDASTCPGCPARPCTPPASIGTTAAFRSEQPASA